MSNRTTTHDTFVIERHYDAPVERVFAAWSTPDAKGAWFGDPAGGDRAHQLDFCVGGREHLSGTAEGGMTYRLDATYYDIIPNERIIWSYDMDLDGAHISVSLGTVEIRAEGDGTALTYTEYGVYLDGRDTPEARAGGTRELLDALGRFLERPAALH
jgi:uncharacterized protein YndB with AHSA1/START domain